MDLLKKAIDPESKEKKCKASKHDLPAWVGKLTGNPANVETKAGRVAVNCAYMENASRKGGLVMLVFHWLVGAFAPRLPLSTSKRGNAGSN